LNYRSACDKSRDTCFYDHTVELTLNTVLSLSLVLAILHHIQH